MYSLGPVVPSDEAELSNDTLRTTDIPIVQPEVCSRSHRRRKDSGMKPFTAKRPKNVANSAIVYSAVPAGPDVSTIINHLLPTVRQMEAWRNGLMRVATCTQQSDRGTVEVTIRHEGAIEGPGNFDCTAQFTIVKARKNGAPRWFVGKAVITDELCRPKANLSVISLAEKHPENPRKPSLTIGSPKPAS
jgi:hypothetical protein